MSFFQPTAHAPETAHNPDACRNCGVARIVMITEQFVIHRRTVLVTLCMRCWLEEHRAA